MRLRYGVLGVALLAVAAEVSGEPVAVLEQYLSGHAEHRSFFEGQRIVVPSSRRAEIASHRSTIHGAIVAWHVPAANRVGSLGGMFCRAALLRGMLGEMLAPRVADARLLEEVLLNAAGAAKFTGLNAHSSGVGEKWTITVCKVASTGIEIDRSEAAVGTTIATAAYGLAKRLISEGKHSRALEILKLTRGDRDVYANGVAVMVYLLSDKSSSVAEQLEAGHVEINRITDPYALNALAEYYSKRGSR